MKRKTFAALKQNNVNRLTLHVFLSHFNSHLQHKQWKKAEKMRTYLQTKSRHKQEIKLTEVQTLKNFRRQPQRPSK